MHYAKKTCLLTIFSLISLLGCQKEHRTIVTNPFPDDSNYPTGTNHQNDELTSISYYSNSATPLKLRCNTNIAGSPQTDLLPVTNSTIEMANGALKNYNTSFPTMPVYRHYWLNVANEVIAMGNACYRKKSDSTFMTTFHSYNRHNEQWIYSVTDQSNNKASLFTDAEWQCFNNDPSPNYWVRYQNCETTPNVESGVVLLQNNISRIATYAYQVNISYTQGDFQCGIDVYWDNTKIGTIGDFTGGNFSVAVQNQPLGAHTLGVKTLDCLDWMPNQDTIGYTFKVTAQVAGTAAKTQNSTFYPATNSPNIQNFSTTIVLN